MRCHVKSCLQCIHSLQHYTRARVARWSYLKKTGPDIKTPHALRKRENGEGYPPSCKIVIAAPQGLGQSPSWKLKQFCCTLYQKTDLVNRILLNVKKILCQCATRVMLKRIADKIPDFHLSDFQWNCQPDFVPKNRWSGQILDFWQP